MFRMPRHSLRTHELLQRFKDVTALVLAPGVARRHAVGPDVERNYQAPKLDGTPYQARSRDQGGQGRGPKARF